MKRREFLTVGAAAAAVLSFPLAVIPGGGAWTEYHAVNYYNTGQYPTMERDRKMTFAVLKRRFVEGGYQEICNVHLGRPLWDSEKECWVGTTTASLR